jgi:hypothetical protein
VRNPVGIGLAGSKGGEDGAAGLAHDIGELEVGILERLLDALDVGGLLAHELLAGPKQVPQRAGALVGNEAQADQAMREQVGKPDRVGDVGLAAGHVLHVRGVGEISVWPSPRPSAASTCQTPVDAGRLRGDDRTVVAFQPVRQGEEPRRHGREGLYLPTDRPVALDQAHRRDDSIVMHVQAGAAGMQNLHGTLLRGRAAGAGPREGEAEWRAPGRQRADHDASEGASGSPGPTDTRAYHTKDWPDLSADGHAIMPQVSFPRVGSVGTN